MSAHTGIEWTDRTWNPITGCSEVSPGCANCYAARLTATRLSTHEDYKGLAVIDDGQARFTGELRFHADRLEEPLHWRKPSRVFVNSMSDLFHDGVLEDWLFSVFGVMALTQRHAFQVLTKRPEKMHSFLSDVEGAAGFVYRAFSRIGAWPTCDMAHEWPLPNVWLGVSTENQNFAHERIPWLLDTPAAVRFISAEPLLGPIRLGIYVYKNPNEQRELLDWVIAGGESGPNARPMHPEWALSLRDQCVADGVPFFFKQWGSWIPIERQGFRPKKRAGTLHELRMHRSTECGEVNELVYHAYPSDANDDHGRYWEMVWIGAKKNRVLDGRTWDEFPDQVHEGKKAKVKLEGTLLRAEQ